MLWPGGPVDLKTYWPPKKLTGPPKTNWPLPQNQTCAMKFFCVNVQFKQCIIKIHDYAALCIFDDNIRYMPMTHCSDRKPSFYCINIDTQA